MTAKVFFKKIEERLVEHLKSMRPQQKSSDIHIGSFEQVLTIFTALMERDARVQADLAEANRHMNEMAREFGLSLSDLEVDDSEDPSLS
jgi:hypothetical protein